MNLKRILFLILGLISFALGTLGIFLPVLPTFPLYLLTAYSFARSSERLHTWFLSTSLYKKHLESYVRKEGMTVNTKVSIIASVTLILLVSAFFMRRLIPVLIILSIVWLFHIIYFVFMVKTIREPAEAS